MTTWRSSARHSCASTSSGSSLADSRTQLRVSWTTGPSALDLWRHTTHWTPYGSTWKCCVRYGWRHSASCRVLKPTPSITGRTAQCASSSAASSQPRTQTSYHQRRSSSTSNFSSSCSSKSTNGDCSQLPRYRRTQMAPTRTAGGRHVGTHIRSSSHVMSCYCLGRQSSGQGATSATTLASSAKSATAGLGDSRFSPGNSWQVSPSATLCRTWGPPSNSS